MKSRGRSPCPEYVPEYRPKIWNARPAQEFNNCYAYQFDALDASRTKKPQPGELSGMEPLDSESFTCDRLRSRISSDYPSTLFLPLKAAEEPCPCGYYKGFMALDPRPGNKDYHFWRQDRDGFYSHKPGDLPAVNVDGDGRLIDNPLTANRNTDSFQYSEPCFFMCVKKR